MYQASLKGFDTMFYENQSNANKQQYKEMLKIIGQLSRLFSVNDSPYLHYRIHENVFCKFLEAKNIARLDCSVDAKKDGVGIGLKTWVGNNDQKVAEFGKNKSCYSDLTGIELVIKIAEYRNERIRVTKRLHGIENMIYHIVKRIPGAMEILECSLNPIDIDNIRLLSARGNDNNTYFTDGRHVYHFSVSKNTLYMIFDEMELLDRIEVEIVDDPYELLCSLSNTVTQPLLLEGELNQITKPKLCLPLYSLRGRRGNKEKYVPEKSGLNMWNAGGRDRNDDEVYIPYNTADRNRSRGFFPPKDTPFTLRLSDGTVLSAKLCQNAEDDLENGKAIMSNPNKDLGKWLLRDVLELPNRTLVTYEMLERFGIDSVIFTKNSDLDYSIEFAEIGTYEKFYSEDQSD